MEIHNAALKKTAVFKRDYPTDGLPEAAFAGRSNVGKSSMINALVNRKALARTSQSPGKTRTINFYLAEDAERALYLVDLPGYGYAKASKEEAASWGRFIETYLKNRSELKLIVLVLDIRHEPTKLDKIMLDFIRYYNYRYVIAATKADKLSRGATDKNIRQLRAALGLKDSEPVIPFSSETKAGKEALWQAIESILAD